MTVTYLITGCSRGLGLALASELSKSDNLIIATARGAPTPALDELIKSSSGRVKYVKLDTTDRESVAAAQKEVTSLLDGKGLDVLINNAGIINWMTEGIEAMYVAFFSNIIYTFHLAIDYLRAEYQGRSQ
jgi:NAD(P)-dependent dehydrogenase (short-subunit alcohol dehydrogenase family)